MIDARSLYIDQILNHYRKPELEDNDYYTVLYRHKGCRKNSYCLMSHNEGLDILRHYIKDLENKLDELQYIEKIIQTAKEK